MSAREARRRGVELLKSLGFSRTEERFDDYPHQLSGGMRQRVMIAIAPITEPDLLIADEPTTALDVRPQAQVMDLMYELADERDMAVLLISHDLAVVAGFADKVAVMYAGRAVEECPVEELFASPEHPYTWGLIRSLPRLDGEVADRMPAIKGQPPSPVRRPTGCRFHPRCDHAMERCRASELPMEVRVRNGHLSACHFAGELRFTRKRDDR